MQRKPSVVSPFVSMQHAPISYITSLELVHSARLSVQVQASRHGQRFVASWWKTIVPNHGLQMSTEKRDLVQAEETNDYRWFKLERFVHASIASVSIVKLLPWIPISRLTHSSPNPFHSAHPSLSAVEQVWSTLVITWGSKWLNFAVLQSIDLSQHIQ